MLFRSPYLSRHAEKAGGNMAGLRGLLEEGANAQVGLILSERFINMPHEIVPPMWTMLLEEIDMAVKDRKEQPPFTHYLVLSKTYNEVESTLPSDDQPPAKKKKGGASAAPETFYFHPEDEVLQRFAVAHASFDYETPVDAGASDSKRAFQELGVKPMAHLILVEADKLGEAVAAVKTYLGGGQ